MREIRQSGSEGGVADNGHPYPYTRDYLGAQWSWLLVGRLVDSPTLRLFKGECGLAV